MSGKKEREKRQVERITQSGQSDMRDLRPTKTETQAVPHESTQVEQNKPIDLWLWLGGVAVGILLYLTAKTPVAVVFWVVVFFFVLLHPVWNFWWIEKSLSRRFAAVTILAIISVGVGYISWPAPPLSSTSLVQSASLSTKQQFLFSSVPAYLVSTGSGTCGLFMSLAGHNTESSPIVATPITYLLWVRLFNQRSYKVVVDRYSVELSDSESGPWIGTSSLPLKSSAYYCNYSDENDVTVNTRAFHAAIESVRGTAIQVAIDGGYMVATSSDPSCLQKCSQLDIPDLQNNLTTGIEAHSPVAGWVAVNPPVAERPILAHRHAFYRITVDTAAGTVVSSGSLSPKPGAIVYTGESYLRLLDRSEADLRRIPLRYVGPLERKK